MNKTTKIALVFGLIAGMIYESFTLISQCATKRSIDVTRQISCKDGNITINHALSACTENASLMLKSSSPVEFLFITNHLGNPVLTLIDLIILIVALGYAIKINLYSSILIKGLITIENILGLILLWLCVQGFCYQYTENWFIEHGYNNTGFTVNNDSTSLLWCCVVLILAMWTNYLRLEIQRNGVERQEVSA